MRAADVVTQLAVLLPQLSDAFTQNVGITSLTRAGTVMTAITAADHGFLVGDAVAITGAVTQIPIDVLTRAGTVGTLHTTADQDLTNDIAQEITISGATEPEFNGTFPLVNVDSRRTIRFTMADAGPVTATGAPVLENGESALRQYDSTYAVETVPDPTTFTFQQPDTTLLDPIGNIEARGKVRISSAVDPDRMRAAYTEKDVGELWLVVALDDVAASKSRMVRSDAIDNLYPSDEFRQQIIQALTLYLYVPAQEEISASDARDLAEDLFRPICQSILGAGFDSGLFVGTQGRMQFSGHGTFAYDTAVYVHGYSFQQVVDLYFQDTVGPDLDVAFRNLDFDSVTVVEGGTQQGPVLTAAIDLDDVPE